MKILESAQNYIETIYMLHQKNPYVRSIDIANELSYSKPSVSVAMKQLRENGYVIVDENGNITLTEKGNKIAIEMYDRHHVIAKALIRIGVDEETAYKDSCKIEHHISEQSFNAIKLYLENAENI